MPISKLPDSAFTASIALIALAGCGGSSQMAPASPARSNVASPFGLRPASQNRQLNVFIATHGDIIPGHGPAARTFMDSRAVGKPLVFAGFNDGIDIYLQGRKNKKVGQITGAPGGGTYLATDTAGNLYSGNYYFKGPISVTVYAPPYTAGPKLTITGLFNGPIAVSRGGTVAVLGCASGSGSQCHEGVLFYGAGSTTPCATVDFDPSFFSNIGAAFDRKGNLYVASGGTGSAAPLMVDRIDGGCNAKKGRIFTTGNSVLYAGGLEVDKAGRIAILEAVAAYPNSAVIDTYDPPKKGSLGNPDSTTLLPGSINNVSGSFTFQASGRRLWAGYDGVGSSYAAAVYEVSYPGGMQQKTILGPPQSVAGVAVTPALFP